MEKIVEVLWGEGGDALRDRLLDAVAPALLALDGVHGLTVNVHDDAAAVAPSPVPTPAGEAPMAAEVSVWVDAYDRRLAAVESVLAPLPLERAAYLVVESVYDDYGTTPHSPPRDWPDGQRSPGVLTVALIHRPASLAYDEWIRRWHGTQSPLSGQLQPRTRYVRNEVVRALTPSAPIVDGIVEEGWPSAEHVADPMLFFNARSKEELDDHLAQMMASVDACLDLARFRSSTMSEHLVRTLGGR